MTLFLGYDYVLHPGEVYYAYGKLMPTLSSQEVSSDVAGQHESPGSK